MAAHVKSLTALVTSPLAANAGLVGLLRLSKFESSLKMINPTYDFIWSLPNTIGETLQSYMLNVDWAEISAGFKGTVMA